MEIIQKVIAGLLTSGIVSFFRGQCELLQRRLWNRTEYGELSTQFHVYYLTNVRRNEPLSKPIWKHGLEHLKVTKRTVKGMRSVNDDPADVCDYTIIGEIRHNKMVLIDVCDKEQANFAYTLYSDLAYTRRLVGIWLGTGADMKVTAGAIILSKTTMTEDELNRSSSLALRFLARGAFIDG